MSAELDAALEKMASSVFRDAAARYEGKAAQRLWNAEDGWIVGYTTSRVVGGRHDGKFVALAYKPVGKGAHSGAARRFERVYDRAFATRKAAKARATAMYRQHSPRWDAKHPAA